MIDVIKKYIITITLIDAAYRRQSRTLFGYAEIARKKPQGHHTKIKVQDKIYTTFAFTFKQQQI
ncbi:hypothetical protein FACS1894199_15920 [Bacteroidia bacterium]|nr:hypothetical protein FACS1894199_15920 [Bacteroidia bacterium]